MVDWTGMNCFFHLLHVSFLFVSNRCMYVCMLAPFNINDQGAFGENFVWDTPVNQ